MINVRFTDKEFDWQSAARDAIMEVETELNGKGRVIVRASGTEALVRVMVEAKDAQLAQSCAEKIAQTIKG